jgi:hypothetical protein
VGRRPIGLDGAQPPSTARHTTAAKTILDLEAIDKRPAAPFGNMK